MRKFLPVAEFCDWGYFLVRPETGLLRTWTNLRDFWHTSTPFWPEHHLL